MLIDHRKCDILMVPNMGMIGAAAGLSDKCTPQINISTEHNHVMRALSSVENRSSKMCNIDSVILKTAVYNSNAPTYYDAMVT